MWKQTSRQQANKEIFEQEFDSFLPDRILDFHVHVFNEGVIPDGASFCCAGHAITKYEFPELEQDLVDLYPQRQTEAVCFGLPFPAYNQSLNDRYVSEKADGKKFHGFRLFDPHEKDHDAVVADLKNGSFRGIKPYLDYVRKADPKQVEINEMLPKWIMEAVNDLELLVMLHIPRSKRLADPLNQQQLLNLCQLYPKARIVLAHVGRAYYLENVVGYLDQLRKLPNLYYDLAMLNNWEVLEYLFATVDQEKVLYATDTPIALAPGKSIEINNQYTYVTPVPWDLSISDERGRIAFTSFVYEELRAIKKAVSRLKLNDKFLENLFYNNGKELLK